MIHSAKLFSIIGIVVSVLSLIGISFSANAQNTCDNPFEGFTPRFGTLFWERTDFCTRSIDLREIRSGGVSPDGIPPIDDPVFESVTAGFGWLNEPSPVIALEIDGTARAYPLAILIYHEIVNDVMNEIPIAVTYCPLCNSAIVYDRRVTGADEQTHILRFGVSGNLRNSDLIMWDDRTQSWWQQFTGEAIVGAYTGTELDIIASQIVSFGVFAERFPEGEVLSRDTGHSRTYGRNPYVGYDTTNAPFLFEGGIDNRLPPTEHVLAGVIDGEPVAYPFSILSQQFYVNDMAGDTPILALWQPGAASALDNATIDASRDVGMAALYSRALDGQTLTFALTEANVLQDEQTGSTWNMFGEAIDGELTGSRLRLLFAAPHFWFAWAAFQPDTRIYGIE